MQGVLLSRERARELCSLLLMKSPDYVNSGLHVAEVDPRGSQFSGLWDLGSVSPLTHSS